MKLTVTVITYNEAEHIQHALESVAWADEIIVVDSGSTDGTVELARPLATRVIVREWPGYSDQKNFAADSASNEWVLSVDADERVTPELAAEIRQLLSSEPQARGYRIRRLSRYLGRWIHSTDWFPDYQLRLYDRRAGRWNGLAVHESFRLNDGAPARLGGELQHFAYRDISHHLQKIDTYTTLLARQAHEQGRRTNPLAMGMHPWFAFLRNFVLRRGFTDGTAGFVISVLNAYYVFLKLAKLWELQGTRPGRDAGRG
ncbi:MAG: glycosyltransferase family 2 protein [Acidobacteriota bacterium]|nr:glycosyltransferase family 2 protein [Acidobacteriota bacterium]MDQ3417888.1 glycosyltransferase family 2 protein [Acidobacteriota bacterium]